MIKACLKLLLLAIAIGGLIFPGTKSWFFGVELRWLYLLLLGFSLSHFLVPFAIRFGHRFGILDQPGGRKRHRVPVPLLGGAVIFLAFAVVVNYNFYYSWELKGVTLGATLVFLLGFLEDVWGLPTLVRPLGHIGAAVILLLHGVRMSFLPDVWLGDLGEIIITVIWVVGLTNAYNFIDGMDGLATGSAIINSFFFGLVSLRTGQEFFMFLAMALLGSCLGFLPYNFRPRGSASIFLGDAGSNFLGFMLAGMALMGDWAQDNWVDLIVPGLILGVPIFDTTLTTVLRIRHGQVRSFIQWLEYTGWDHFHHRLAELGIGDKGAVVVIYVVTTWLGLSALVLRGARGLEALLQLTQASIIFLLIAFFMVYVKKKFIETPVEIEGPNGSDEMIGEKKDKV